MKHTSDLLQYWSAIEAVDLSDKKRATESKRQPKSNKSNDAAVKPDAVKTNVATSGLWRQLAEALLWGAACLDCEIDDAFERLSEVSHLLQLLSQKKITAKQAVRGKALSQSLAMWINRHLPLEGNDKFVALIATGWIYAMQYATANIASSLWLETLQNILTQVDRAWNDTSDDSVVPTILWGCEIPLALATQIHNPGGPTKLVLDTRQRLQFLISKVDDAKRLWLRQGASETRALLAATIRCCHSLEQLDVKPLRKQDAKSVVKYACAALSLSQLGGQPLLQDQMDTQDNKLWYAVAERFGPDAKLTALTKLITRDPKYQLQKENKAERVKLKPSKKTKKTKSTLALESQLPPLGQQFGSAESAVMRCDWSSQANLLAIDYSIDPMWLDVYDGKGTSLIRGGWDLQLQRGGDEVAIDSSWQKLCWLSDDDVDYLELQCEAEGLCKIQRQVLLIRSERILFLCDTLLADQPADWEYQSTLQLGDDVFADSSKDNTELHLKTQKKRYKRAGSSPAAIILPIALPEWKRGCKSGSLASMDGQVFLRQTTSTSRMMCPLVIGLDITQKQTAYTWRHLTVADEMKIQPQEAARGFRVQIGSDQLLFYRSLGEHRRRTMMSLHLLTEFYAGRFDANDGDIETLVEVSTEDL